MRPPGTGVTMGESAFVFKAQKGFTRLNSGACSIGKRAIQACMA
jgi:hypothetical protein